MACFFWLLSGVLCILEMMYRNMPSITSQQIMSHYGLSCTQFGLLVSTYYYPYLLMQIPGGILLDYWGARRMSIFIAFGSSCAFFLFITGTEVWQAFLGRILLGFSAACAFITTLKIVSDWFDKSMFPVMSGLTNMMLTFGGIAAGTPLACLVENCDWKLSGQILVVFGIILGGLIYVFLKDPPVKDIKRNEFNASNIKKELVRISTDKTLWKLGLLSACMYLPFSAFAELWATPYISTVYNLSVLKASSISILLYVGAAFGSYFIPLCVKKPQYYTQILRISILTTIGMFLLISFFTPGISLLLLRFAFFTIGFAIGAQILIFVRAVQIGQDQEQGARLGFINAVTSLGPVLVQPLLGFALDLFCDNKSGEYSAKAYNQAILIFPIMLFVGIFIVNFLNEHPKRDR